MPPSAAEPKQFLSGQHEIRVATVVVTDSNFPSGCENAVAMDRMDKLKFDLASKHLSILGDDVPIHPGLLR